MVVATEQKIVGKPQKVIVMGNPLLHQKAQKIADPRSLQTKQIVADMQATIEAEGSDNIGGLAAPQVAILYRVLIIQIPENITPGEAAVPQTVLINPEIEFIDDKKDVDYEACVSVPGLAGEVPRYRNIKYTYQTMEGETKSVNASGLHARLIQHEVDHLDGILYPQRMTDITKLGFIEEIKQNLQKQKKAS